MPLESLSQPFNPDEPGRKLREVQREEVPIYENTAELKYNALKVSDFYDQEKKLWRDGVIMDAWSPKTQFLGLMALAEFDPNSARQQWEALHHKESFHKDDTVWTWGELKQAGSGAKLFSIALMSYFDRKKGAAEYAKYFQQVDASDVHKMPQLLDGSSDIFAEAELQHLLIQSILNPAEARARYQVLKATQLYDEASHLWHSNCFWDIGPSESFYSDISLLSILVELQLEIPGAQERYEAIKSSPLFDEESQLWKDSFYRKESSKGILTEPQLLAVIVESRIEKMKNPTEFSTPHSIPEERNF